MWPYMQTVPQSAKSLGPGPALLPSPGGSCFDDRLLLGLTVFPQNFTCGDAKQALLVSTSECHPNVPVNFRGSTE